MYLVFTKTVDKNGADACLSRKPIILLFNRENFRRIGILKSTVTFSFFNI
jgi:hypothetical protein